jgi:hypothetical protein
MTIAKILRYLLQMDVGVRGADVVPRENVLIGREEHIVPLSNIVTNV